MMTTAKKITQAFPTALETEHYNLEINTGAIAGQVVFHAHLHIIPRHEGDGLELWHGKPYEEGEAKIIADKIKNAL
jgi:histidine triad (HIT) family protein